METNGGYLTFDGSIVAAEVQENADLVAPVHLVTLCSKQKTVRHRKIHIQISKRAHTYMRDPPLPPRR